MALKKREFTPESGTIDTYGITACLKTFLLEYCVVYVFDVYPILA